MMIRAASYFLFPERTIFNGLVHSSYQFEMVVSSKCSLFMRVSVMRALTVVIIHFLFRSNSHFIFIALPFSYCLLICVCKIHIIHAASGCNVID